MNSKNKEKDIREIEVKNVEENPCKKKVVCFEITKSIFKIIIIDRRTFKCPHTGCGRAFKEKGNLRTHIRIHVREEILISLRPVSAHSYANLKDVEKASSPSEISKATH